ncbi:hypothetical protein PTI98_007812 [Pleurotus ostreatus]|nr:hypothetical protein PTI98_007812 [Pleurotus ostreatus]
MEMECLLPLAFMVESPYQELTQVVGFDAVEAIGLIYVTVNLKKYLFCAERKRELIILCSKLEKEERGSVSTASDTALRQKCKIQGEPFVVA